MQWHWITPTQYVLADGNRDVRLVHVREPYMNESDGTKYCVSGDGHEASIHGSLDEAVAAAEASYGHSRC